MLKQFRYFAKLFTSMVIAGLLPMLAFADNATLSGGGISQILMPVCLFGLMYFFIIRPQTKKAKEHRQLLAGIISGDEVITVGGLVGQVAEVLDHFVIIKIANNVEVKIQKQAISQILPNSSNIRTV